MSRPAIIMVVESGHSQGFPNHVKIDLWLVIAMDLSRGSDNATLPGSYVLNEIGMERFPGVFI